MPRNRRDTRGKKIFWKSPVYIAVNIDTSDTPAYILRDGPTNSVNRYGTWYHRSPMYATGLVFASDLDTIPSIFTVKLLKNDTTVYTSSAITLNSAGQRNIPQRLEFDEHIKFIKEDNYSFRFSDSQNRTNECTIYVYGYYYESEFGVPPTIYYESPVFTNRELGNSFQNTYLCDSWNESQIGIGARYEDVNPVFITHIAIGSGTTLTSTIGFYIERNNLNISQNVDGVDFDASSNEEKVIKLDTPFWIKPTDNYEIIALDSQNRDYGWSFRLIGYRRELQGRYRFSKQSSFYYYDVLQSAWTEGYINRQNQFVSGKFYYEADPLMKVVGTNIVRKFGTNTSPSERLTTSGTQSSDSSGRLSLSSTIEDFWALNFTSPLGTYKTNNAYNGMDVNQSGNAGGEYQSRLVSEISL